MNTITEYHGIKLGEMLREIATGKTGKIVEFDQYPDGMFVVCEDETSIRWGAYLDNCEFTS